MAEMIETESNAGQDIEDDISSIQVRGNPSNGRWGGGCKNCLRGAILFWNRNI